MTTNEQLDYIVKKMVEYVGDNVIFHGGYLMCKFFPEIAIPAQDIDCSITYESVYSSVREVLYSVCMYLMDTGDIDGFTVKDVISVNRPGGVDAYFDSKKVLGVNVNIRKNMYDTRMLRTDVGDINIFGPNTLLADKLVDILPGKRLDHAKDMYDLFLLTSHMDFDINTVRQYIHSRDKSVLVNMGSSFPFSVTDRHIYQNYYWELCVDVPFVTAYARLCRVVESLSNMGHMELI